jgi:hypothetical protein
LALTGGIPRLSYEPEQQLLSAEADSLDDARHLMPVTAKAVEDARRGT